MNDRHKGHTPGPWVAEAIEDDDCYIVASGSADKNDGWPICTPHGADAKANAALIADAPKLLAQRDALAEALKALLREQPCGVIPCGNQGCTAEKARAALAALEPNNDT